MKSFGPLANGFWKGIEGVGVEENDLVLLLSTVKGERVMQPFFGVNAIEAVFENMSAIQLASLEANIANAIAQFCPNIKLDALKTVRSDQVGSWVIELYYTVLGKQSVAKLKL